MRRPGGRTISRTPAILLATVGLVGVGVYPGGGVGVGLGLGVTGGVAHAAAAATTDRATRELTLDQALAMARKSNRSLTAERARLAEAAATVDQAWTVLFPSVGVQGKYTRNNVAFVFPNPVSGRTLTIQPRDQLDGVVNFSLPLLVPAAYPGLKAVNLTARVTEENVLAAEDAVLFGVAQTFYAAATADEILVARQSNVEVARATVENARTRFSAGTVTKVDVDRAQLALLRAEQSEREAKLAREQTYRALGTLIQAQEPFHVRVPASATSVVESAASGTTAAASRTPSGEEMNAVLRLRPEFRALETAVQAEEEQRRAYAWRWAPSVSGFGVARVFNYDNFAGESHSWALGAQLDWAIYDAGVRDAQRRLVAAQAVETAARAEVLRESIRDDLVNGRQELETKGQAQRTFERSVDLARETLELVRIQYEAGSSTQIDLLQAQDTLVAAQQALAQAHFEVAVADLTVRRAAGTFPGR